MLCTLQSCHSARGAGADSANAAAALPLAGARLCTWHAPGCLPASLQTRRRRRPGLHEGVSMGAGRWAGRVAAGGCWRVTLDRGRPRAAPLPGSGTCPKGWPPRPQNVANLAALPAPSPMVAIWLRSPHSARKVSVNDSSRTGGTARRSADSSGCSRPSLPSPPSLGDLGEAWRGGGGRGGGRVGEWGGPVTQQASCLGGGKWALLCRPLAGDPHPQATPHLQLPLHLVQLAPDAATTAEKSSRGKRWPRPLPPTTPPHPPTHTHTHTHVGLFFPTCSSFSTSSSSLSPA